MRLFKMTADVKADAETPVTTSQSGKHIESVDTMRSMTSLIQKGTIVSRSQAL